jgi:general secretion pathway protein A
MYKEYFGLKELPFSIAPDPRYLYMSNQHREALAHLIYGINTQGGFVLLTGEVGTGKTTVCRCLLDQMPENIDVAFILNPKMTAEELLASICDELRIQYPQNSNSIKIFVDRINTYLLDAHTRGRKTVLIIEEAQNLSTDVLEQIRLLTNLETNQEKLLQIIMLGQPELREKLSRPELRQLSQRITARYHLGSLSRQEISEYVGHRLSIAGVHRKLFPDSVINTLHRLSNGIPRLINLICDRALLGTYVQGKDRVDKNTLLKAAREVFGKSSHQIKNLKILQWALPGILIAGLIVIAFVITIQSSEKKTRATVSVEEKPQLSRLAWPEGLPMNQSEEMAFHALLTQWGIVDKQNSDNPCAIAQSRGLKCLHAHESLNSLIQLNRPAVLKIFDDQDREFFVTLTKIQNQTAHFVIGKETKRVDVKDIALQWRGDYIILWRMPPVYKSFIKHGTKGPQVKWLDERLANVLGKQNLVSKDAVFDDELLKRVKEFQLSRGLIPDGVVGTKTIIHLNLTSKNGDPVLSEKQKET